MMMRTKKVKGIPKLENDRFQRLHGTGALICFYFMASNSS